MNSADEYRKRADDFSNKARETSDRLSAAEWHRLARWYVRLAEEAERNSMLDLVYEPPPPKLSEA
jgi:hypothetical protein